MRDLIKIIIALAFMAVAFFIGKYLANEKCSVQLKEMNEKSSIDQKRIEQLQDSLTLLKTETVKINLAKIIDTLRTKIPEIKRPTQKNTQEN